jgi:transposase
MVICPDEAARAASGGQMRHKLFGVVLSADERRQVWELTRRGTAPARVLTRAHILLAADDGAHDASTAASLHVSANTVAAVRRRFVERGRLAALHDRPRPGAARLLDAKQEAFLVALACSAPPAGQAVWTMQVLAEELVRLGRCDGLSDETVRRTLKKTCSSRGSGRNGASPK